MDQTKLTVLRGKLEAIERGFSFDLYEASEVRTQGQELLEQYPDMPADERARCEALKTAGMPTRGKPC